MPMYRSKKLAHLAKAVSCKKCNNMINMRKWMICVALIVGGEAMANGADDTLSKATSTASKAYDIQEIDVDFDYKTMKQKLFKMLTYGSNVPNAEDIQEIFDLKHGSIKIIENPDKGLFSLFTLRIKSNIKSDIHETYPFPLHDRSSHDGRPTIDFYISGAKFVKDQLEIGSDSYLHFDWVDTTHGPDDRYIPMCVDRNELDRFLLAHGWVFDEKNIGMVLEGRHPNPTVTYHNSQNSKDNKRVNVNLMYPYGANCVISINIYSKDYPK